MNKSILGGAALINGKLHKPVGISALHDDQLRNAQEVLATLPVDALTREEKVALLETAAETLGINAVISGGKGKRERT